MLVIVFLGLLRASTVGVMVKRVAAVIGIITTVSLLFFFTDLECRLVGKQSISLLRLALEIIIPEISICIPIAFFLYRTATRCPKILDKNNYDLSHNADCIRSLLTTQFNISSRLRQLVQTETRFLRYLICSQLVKSCTQFPSIQQSPHFPRKYLLITIIIIIIIRNYRSY